MGKNFWKKYIIAGLILAGCICSANTYISPTPQAYAYVNVIKGENEITITNTNLKKRLCTLLGKGTNDKFYIDDFITNENYKPNSTTDEKTGITTTSALIEYLDLSNAGLDDISELAYFTFPETLTAIDLGGNNITQENLVQLQNFLDLEEDSTINCGDIEIASKSNFKDIIKKVNLNYNKIDLDSSVAQTALNDSRLLFGIQNLDMNTSGLILKSDLSQVKYYIRTEDILYLSYNFYWNNAKEDYRLDEITPFTSNHECGIYKIIISNPPSTATGYFYGLSTSTNFTMFDIYIKDSFKVQRKSLFNLKVNLKSPNGADIILEGINDDVDITYTDPQTNIVGTSYVNLIIKYNNQIKAVSLPFTVIDTISPTITLKGYQKMYWKQNKTWEDPGYTALDSGDDLSQFVNVDLGGLDVTTCGSYTITYSLNDHAGNPATTTRTVIVQEEVLDEIIVTCNKTDYRINDEIILTVQPASNSPLSNYSDYKYSWYMDGVLFQETTGDSITGKSSITMIANKSVGKITVTLNAKQNVDNSNIYVDSKPFELNPSMQLSDNTSIIIACVVAVVIILLIIIIAYFLKVRKSKQKISGKKKNSKGGTQGNKQDIQVIKDYQDNNKQ